MKNTILPKPAWIRGKVSWDNNFNTVKNVLRKRNLNSVCVDAVCPNKGECWKNKHITFMILGSVCTRGCKFCNVESSHLVRLNIPGAVGCPGSGDGYSDEPENIAEAVKELGMEYVVITSVTRDDLEDKGSGQFINTVKEIKKNTPEVLTELLIPDFDADQELLKKTAFSEAEVIGHNIEMPESLYPEIRPGSSYAKSIKVLNTLSLMKKQGADILVKSSMILGLGETELDIINTLKDLKFSGVDIVHIGQYLSPSPSHWPVKKYYRPEEFKSLAEQAKQMGFPVIYSAPMVRSSYRAEEKYRLAG